MPVQVYVGQEAWPWRPLSELWPVMLSDGSPKGRGLLKQSQTSLSNVTAMCVLQSINAAYKNTNIKHVLASKHAIFCKTAVPVVV